MSKILKIGNSALAALLAVLGIIFTIIAIGDPNSFLGGLAFRVAYVLIALCTIVAVGAFIILLVTNFKKYYMVLVWIALMAIIVGVCWAAASGSLPAESTQMGKKWLQLGVTEGMSKFAGMAGFISYFFAGAAIFAIIFFEVRNLFK